MRYDALDKYWVKWNDTHLLNLSKAISVSLSDQTVEIVFDEQEYTHRFSRVKEAEDYFKLLQEKVSTVADTADF